MKARIVNSEKGEKQVRGHVSSADQPQREVMPTLRSPAFGPPSSGLQAGQWTSEWESFWRNALAQQEEGMGWWSRFPAGGSDQDCLPCRGLAFGQQLVAAAHGAADKTIRLTLRQQQVAVSMLQEANHLGPLPPAKDAQAFFHRSCTSALELGRAWFALVASAQGGVVNAWADLWLLPAAEPGA